MKNRWTDENAGAALERWGHLHGEGFATRLYTARLLGADPSLVLHGGGNVSWKCKQYATPLGDKVEVMFVKRSGADLAILEPADLPAVEIGPLQRLGAHDTLCDETLAHELRRCYVEDSLGMPSIETLLHAALPYTYVDHTHANALLAITNRADGEKRIREIFDHDVAILPYIRPGLELGRAVVQCYQASPNITGIILLKHGLVTFADDARQCYERHLEMVSACERYLDKHKSDKPLTVSFSGTTSAQKLATQLSPILRGKLAIPTGNPDRPQCGMMMEWRGSDDILTFVNSRQAKEIAGSGPLTGDHVIRTKPWPLFLADWSGQVDQFETGLCDSLESFQSRYDQYLKTFDATNSSDRLPRVVLIPGAGLFAFGATKRDAIIAADLAEQTIVTKVTSRALGSYEPLGDEHLADVEFRPFQRAKLGVNSKQELLMGQVVIISGGAGAIGSAIAHRCLEAGAHVALIDLDADKLKRTKQALEDYHESNLLLTLVADVTNEATVNEAFDQTVLHFGGVDVVVPNAGIAHVAAIDKLSTEDFRRVMEVNTVGYLNFMREGIRILKKQGIGGHVIINASKNVFGPGKDFGAYSASKAAGHQLGKVAAIETAPFGIRVNMINADAVFGEESNPSGLWETVGPQRAKSRNLTKEELPDYYRQRNLLKTRVLGRHVGNAVVFFASNATPTTGATLPVDGGVVDAFPR